VAGLPHLSVVVVDSGVVVDSSVVVVVDSSESEFVGVGPSGPVSPEPVVVSGGEVNGAWVVDGGAMVDDSVDDDPVESVMVVALVVPSEPSFPPVFSD